MSNARKRSTEEMRVNARADEYEEDDRPAFDETRQKDEAVARHLATATEDPKIVPKLTKREARAHSRYCLTDEEIAEYHAAIRMKNKDAIYEIHKVAIARYDNTKKTVFAGCKIPIGVHHGTYHVPHTNEKVALIYNLLEMLYNQANVDNPVVLLDHTVLNDPTLERFLVPHIPFAHNVKVIAYVRAADTSTVRSELTDKAEKLTVMATLTEYLDGYEDMRRRIISLSAKTRPKLLKILKVLRAECNTQQQNIDLRTLYTSTLRGTGTAKHGGMDAERLRPFKAQYREAAFLAHSANVLAQLLCNNEHGFPHVVAPEIKPMGAEVFDDNGVMRFVGDGDEPGSNNAVTLKMLDYDSEYGTNVVEAYLKLQQLERDMNELFRKIVDVVKKSVALDVRVTGENGESRTIAIADCNEDIQHALGKSCYLPSIVEHKGANEEEEEVEEEEYAEEEDEDDEDYDVDSDDADSDEDSDADSDEDSDEDSDADSDEDSDEDSDDNYSDESSST